MMEDADIPKKDKDTILRAKKNLEILYHRYIKHLLGWKKASDRKLNQQFLLSQMDETVLMFSKWALTPQTKLTDK